MILDLPALHPGQERALALFNTARFLVLRCGRRWGKTEFLMHLAMITAMDGHPVAYVVADFSRMLEVWEAMTAILEPIIQSKNESKKRIRLINGAVIKFWSLDGAKGEDVGRSGKYKLVCIDEAGIAPNLKAAWRKGLRATLIDLKGKAVFGSTSKSAVPFFNQLFNRGQADGKVWASMQCKQSDNPYIDPMETAAARDDMSELEAAVELDGAAAESNWQYFSADMVESYVKDICRPPVLQGNLSIGEGIHLEERDRRIGKRMYHLLDWTTDFRNGRIRLWCDLVDGMPSRERRYAMGWDLSRGLGASNTIGYVADVDARRIVAEYASPKVRPDEAARIACMMGLWFRGVDSAAGLLYEKNGPGEDFAEDIVKVGYPTILTDEDGDAGWWSTPQSKETLLNNLRKSYANRSFINPSEKGLLECLLYVENESNQLVAEVDAQDDETGAKQPHADRCIASGVTERACGMMARLPVPKPKPHPDSPAARAERRQKEVSRNRADDLMDRL